MADLATIAHSLVQALPAAEAAATDSVAVATASANGLLGIAKGLVYGLAAAGASIGIAMVVSSTLNGITRQPEQTGTLRGLMFLGVGFIEALALLGFVALFLIK